MATTAGAAIPPSSLPWTSLRQLTGCTRFIDECHNRGIAVILDVVYNHATGANPFARMWWDAANNKTATNNPYFNVDAPHPYSVFHDFNHESELVRNFVKRNLKFLLEEYNIDGFRFDLTKGFTQRTSTESTAGNYDASRIAILKDYNRPSRRSIRGMGDPGTFCRRQEETELQRWDDGVAQPQHAYVQQQWAGRVIQISGVYYHIGTPDKQPGKLYGEPRRGTGRLQTSTVATGS